MVAMNDCYFIVAFLQINDEQLASQPKYAVRFNEKRSLLNWESSRLFCISLEYYRMIVVINPIVAFWEHQLSNTVLFKNRKY
jgi:hypothetical protein